MTTELYACYIVSVPKEVKSKVLENVLIELLEFKYELLCLQEMSKTEAGNSYVMFSVNGGLSELQSELNPLIEYMIINLQEEQNNA